MQKIFIIGVGRSGTTLLQSMLNAHSEIACPPESHFIRKYLQNRDNNEEINPNDIKDVLVNDNDLNRLNISFDQAIDFLYKSSMKITLENIFLAYMELYVKNENKQIFGEKDPSNSSLLKVIYKFYPDAYILHIIRDPRDVILSRKKSGWGSKTPLLGHVKDYKNDINLARLDGKKLFNEKYMELYYEKLILDSNAVLNSVCQFLSLDYEESMLEYYKTSDKLFTKDEKQWKDNVTKPLMKDNMNKWKKGLTTLEIKYIESYCSNVMNDLGYVKKYETTKLVNIIVISKVLLFTVKRFFSKIIRKIKK